MQWARIKILLTRPGMVVFGLFVVGLIFQLLSINAHISFLDNGFNANMALRVAHGEIPYRDIFSLITPLHFLVGGFLVKVFGASLLPLTIVGCLVGAGTAAFVFVSVRRLASPVLALVAWLVSIGYLGFLSYYSYTAAFFIAIAMYAGIRATQSGRWHWFVTLGAALSLAYWSKQTIGIYASVGLLVFLFPFRSAVRRIAPVAAGAIAVSLPFLIFLWVNAATREFFEDTIIVPLTVFRNQARLPVPALNTIGLSPSNFENTVFLLATIVTLVTLVWCAYEFFVHKRGQARLFVALASSGMLLLALERYSFSSFRAVIPFAAAAAAVGHASFRAQWAKRAFEIVATGLLFCMFLINIENLNVHFSNNIRYRHGLDALRSTTSEVSELEYAVNFLTTHRGERVAVVPMTPIYYFYADVQNPTRYDLWVPGNITPKAEDEIADALDTKIDYVLFHEYWLFDGLPFKQYAPRLNKILLDKFKVVAQSPDNVIQIYVRKKKL